MAQWSRCRLTTKLSDGAPALKHAGAPALVCALGSAARGRALYANRRSLQRLVRRLASTHGIPTFEALTVTSSISSASLLLSVVA